MVTSRMLETYCADIERLIRGGMVRAALRLSLTLPTICSALEDVAMKSSKDGYLAWCAAWLTVRPSASGKPIDGARLYKVHIGRARLRRTDKEEADQTGASLARLRRARRTRGGRTLERSRVWQPHGVREAFQVRLSEDLLMAVRRWYRELGATSTVVQKNLGRLILSG